MNIMHLLRRDRNYNVASVWNGQCKYITRATLVVEFLDLDEP